MIPHTELVVGRYYVVGNESGNAVKGPYPKAWQAAAAMTLVRKAHFVGYWSPGWQKVVGI